MPDDLELLFALPTSYLSARRYEDAERAFAQIREARPIPQTRVLIGRAYRDAAEFDRARAEFQAALAQDPRVRRAHYYLGMAILLDEGVAGVEQALIEFGKELEVSPADPATHTFLGAALLLAGRPQEALPSLELATRSPAAPARRLLPPRAVPAGPRPAGRRGCCGAQGARASAGLVRGLAPARDPLPARPRPAQDGRPRGGGRPPRRGAASFLPSADRGPAAEFGAPLADVLVAEAPRPAIDPALVASPVAGLSPQERTKLHGQVAETLARAYVNLGVIETQGQRFERAAERFAAAARLSPEFPQVDYFLGVARYNAGQFVQAAESLERAGASRPGDADLRRMLAMAWFNTGDYAKAIPLLRDDPQLEANPSLQLSYLVALVRSGDAAGAVTALEAAARRESQSAEIHSLLAEAYRALGRTEEAQQQLEIVRRLDESRRPGPP